VILPPFELHRPRSLAEALEAARASGGDFDFIAGGTDLLPNYKQRLNARRHVISLAHVPELSELSFHPDGGARIGAFVRLADLEADPVVRERYPAVVEAASEVASILIRQSATVGGNILVETRCYYFNQSEFWRAAKGYCLKADGDVCLVVPQKTTCYATYSGDLAPVFMALGASFRLVSLDGERNVPAREFFLGDGIEKNVLRRGEVLASVDLPAAASGCRAGYRKLRIRDTFDFPLLGVAAALRAEPGDPPRIADLTVVVNAIHPRPLLMDEATRAVALAPLTPAVIDDLARDIEKRARAYRNVSLPPSYRKQMVGVYVRRLLRELAGFGES